MDAAPNLGRSICFVFAAALLCTSSVSSASTESFHARFEPSAAEGAPVQIFIDGFESGGTCDWVSTAACTLYIITIPLFSGSGDHHFPAVIHLQIGAELHIVNGDTTPHRIHANNTIGLLHQNGDMTQGQEYVGTVNQTGSDVLYCHDHGTGAGSMTVEVP